MCESSLERLQKYFISCYENLATHVWMWIDHLNWYPNFIQHQTTSIHCSWKKFLIVDNVYQTITVCANPRYSWLYVIIMSCYYHVALAFQSESTLCSYLNVKELLAWNRRDIWSLSDSNRIRTHNHLLCKRTLNHLVFVYELSGCGCESRCCRGRIAFGKKIFCRTLKPKFRIAMPQSIRSLAMLTESIKFIL